MMKAYDEKMMKLIHTIELHRLNEQHGRKTYVRVKGRPMFTDFAKISDDTILEFNNEQAANYYIFESGDYILVAAHERVIDDDHTVVEIVIEEV